MGAAPLQALQVLASCAGAGSQSDGQEAVRTQALQATAQGLLSLQPRVSLPNAAALAIAVAQIGTVIMERSPTEFAKASPEVNLQAANRHTMYCSAAQGSEYCLP